MRKFCIVSFCNMYILPYASVYIDAICKSGAECTLMFWDRDAVDGQHDCQDTSCKYVCYQNPAFLKSIKISKIYGYVGATKFFKKQLSNIDYDGVIFLQSHAAVACKSILLKKYAHRYIVDIRDYTLENISFYLKAEKAVLEQAYKVVISSPAYKEFLPAGDYVLAHNYIPFSQSTIDYVQNKRSEMLSDPINISFIGAVRFYNMDKKILQLFKNDGCFCINYFGTGSEILKEYCIENKIQNVKFYGSFPQSQTADFYLKTDLINNLYGNHDRFLDYALSKVNYAKKYHKKSILYCLDLWPASLSA